MWEIDLQFWKSVGKNNLEASEYYRYLNMTENKNIR